jgi:hypothetical protein
LVLHLKRRTSIKKKLLRRILEAKVGGGSNRGLVKTA